MTKTYGELLTNATSEIAAAGSHTPQLDARLLLQCVLCCDHSRLISIIKKSTKNELATHYQTLVRRRTKGESVHRIMGYREFYGLGLRLSADTLEPRPDTECLIDMVLRYLKKSKRQMQPLRFADLGTGTGAIALALMSKLTKSTCLATDESSGAINTALENARSLGFSDRITTKTGDWCDALDGKFDFVVSNPPYIAKDELLKLSPEVLKHDPLLALDGGTDGLDAYRKIFRGVIDHLNKDAFVALEVGHRQRFDVTCIAAKFGFELQHVEKDLANIDRCLLFAKQKRAE